MSWLDWIPTIIEGIGLFQDRDNASRPDMPDPIDLEQLTRLMMVNSRSPFGNMTYTQGDNGQYTGEYQFSDQVQPAFDRFTDRAANPDQAYQMPEQLRGLHEALMTSRMGNAGGVPRTAPRPERRQYTGPQSPFGQADEAGPTPSAPYGGQTAPAGRDPANQSGGYNSSRYGYGSGYGLGSGGSYGTAAPAFGSSGRSGGSFNDYLNRIIPGAEQSISPGTGEQFLAENLGRIGTGIGAATGIPGLGMLGNAIADYRWNNTPWQSPADTPPSGNDMINESVRNSPYNMGNMGAQQSGIPALTYYGNLGSWQGFQSGGSGPIKWVYGRTINDN